MRVLINMVGPWQDNGEAAMLIVIANEFRRKYPNAEIVAEATTFCPSDKDKEKYGQYNINLIPGFFQDGVIFTNKSKSKRILSLFSQMLKYSLWVTAYSRFGKNIHSLINEKETIFDMYRTADCIVFCGGQNIREYNWSSLVSFFIIRMGKRLNIPTMIWANGMGPFRNRFFKPVARRVLDSVDLITVRDDFSKQFLDELDLKQPVPVTADAAFLLPSITREQAISLLSPEIDIKRGGIMVGITAINRDYAPKDGVGVVDNYIKVMAQAIDYLICRYDAEIVFFPHNTVVGSQRNDRLAASNIIEQVKEQSRVTLLAGEYSPEELKGMYGCMDLFIGTRLHSCIFSLGARVPTIGIEYDFRGHKHTGIFKMANLESYVCDINSLTLPQLQEKIDFIMNNRDELIKTLRKNMDHVESKSSQTIDLAGEYLHIKI